jgi:hypothetical protein
MNCQIIVITTIVPPHRIPGEIDPSTRCDTVWTPPAKRLDGQGQKRAPAGPNKMLITDEHNSWSHVSCYVRRGSRLVAADEVKLWCMG